jgi:hypothetical protein
MDINILKKHTPGAKFVTKALIPNWELQFNYFNHNYNGGVTGIEPAINKLVMGAVYEIPPNEMEHLDTILGLPEGTHYRQPIMIVSETGTPIIAHTYRTTNPRGPYKPTKQYLKHIIDGAKALKLPLSYIESITTETID